MNSTTWECQEFGWYTSELGGICQERDNKWYFYPAAGTKTNGPFVSLVLAKQFAESHEPPMKPITKKSTR